MRPIGIILFIALLVVGCTQQPRSASEDQLQSVTEPQSPSSGPPPADLGDPVSAEPGKIVVRSAKSQYHVGEVIVIMVINGLDRTIYSDDFKTDCSIVTLQRLALSRWESITGCALGRPTMTVAVGSGRGRTISIAPRSLHLRKAAGSSEFAFGTGTFRIAFSYRFTAHGSSDQTVYSPTFPVQ